jgi:hypothetical protein
MSPDFAPCLPGSKINPGRELLTKKLISMQIFSKTVTKIFSLKNKR